MKRLFVVASVFLLVSAAGAVVYENGSSPSNNVSDGEMAITSTGSSASGSTAVGPNGTEYSVKVRAVGQTGTIGEDRLENVSKEEGKVSFKGFIQSPTPCHSLRHNVSDGADGYKLNIYLEESEQACAQQRVMKEYNAEMEAEESFTLEVQHEGQTVQEIETGQSQKEKPSLLDLVIGLFNNLF